MLFQSIFEIVLIAFTLWALFNENKIAKYEKIFFQKVKNFLRRWSIDFYINFIVAGYDSF